jgi:hypothetical protein
MINDNYAYLEFHEISCLQSQTVTEGDRQNKHQ